MQFLAPLFLAALAALAVPIALHIRRRRPRERVAFSAVEFLDESAPAERRHLRLQDIQLLLLRCLAIALLVLAFTRPFFGSPSAGMSGGRLEVLLVDTSASMRGAKLAEAKKQAVDILAGVPTDSRTAIATFDDAFHPLLSVDSGDIASARAAIDSIQGGWSSTNLAAALEGAIDIIAQDREVSGSREAVIHLISDLQQSAVTDGLDAASWPPGVRIIPRLIGGENWTNAGVQIVTTASNPNARILNSADSEGADFPLRWSSGSSERLHVEPGATVDLPIPTDTDHVDLTGDPFDFDNRAWIAPPFDASVAVDYRGADSAEDTTGSLFFLSKALSASTNPKVDLRCAPVENSHAAALTIIDQPLSGDDARALRASLEAGGAALLVLGDTGMQTTLEALAGSGIPLEEVEPDRPALWGRVDFDDPVFAQFSDPRYSNFSSIATWRYRRVSAPEGARVLAAFSSGDPAMLRFPVGRGTLFVLTTSWRPGDSQLALSSKFAPILFAMLAESSDFLPPSTQVSVGAQVRLPRGVSTRIRTPSGQVVDAPAGVFHQTTEPGLYHTEGDRFVFAVNPPAQETDLSPISAASLRALGIPLDPVGTTTALKTLSPGSGLENRQKWWRWLILAAIVALVTETAAAAWSTRNQPVHS